MHSPTTWVTNHEGNAGAVDSSANNLPGDQGSIPAFPALFTLTVRVRMGLPVYCRTLSETSYRLA